jgi:hypothetical protein
MSKPKRGGAGGRDVKTAPIDPPKPAPTDAKPTATEAKPAPTDPLKPAQHRPSMPAAPTHLPQAQRRPMMPPSAPRVAPRTRASPKGR